ncbi:ORF87-like protein [Bufonid herpesvirus 1]|uniref:ORF87-like protein n=1 Tax=Bufonid herpesvirus 1 TaxID=2282206 RepID=UPI000EB63B97|nr:ORF87-like protein [Bufonid herpesvirus 1]AXF48545.1 ORF87-like protein [Bufonid herpesvirus 1]
MENFVLCCRGPTLVYTDVVASGSCRLFYAAKKGRVLYGGLILLTTSCSSVPYEMRETIDFEWLTKEAANTTEMLFVNDLKTLSCFTKLGFENYVRTVYADKIREISPKYETAKSLVRSTLSMCQEKGVHVGFHNPIVRCVLQGQMFDDALKDTTKKAGFDVLCTNPATGLHPPLLKTPLDTVCDMINSSRETTNKDQVCKQPKDKNLAVKSTTVVPYEEVADMVVAELLRINSARSQYRKNESNGVGKLYVVDMNKFQAYKRLFGDCFTDLVKYVAPLKSQTEPLSIQQLEILSLPPRSQWGLYNPILLLSDNRNAGFKYIIADHRSMDLVWQTGVGLCWNEIFIRDRIVTQLILDVDLKSKNVGHSAKIEEKAINDDIVNTAGRIPVMVLKVLTGHSYSSNDCGCVAVYRRAAENKLSLRVLWKLPLQLCRWDGAGIKPLVTLVKTITKAVNLRFFTQTKLLVTSDSGKWTWYTDPVTGNWFCATPDCPAKATDVSFLVSTPDNKVVLGVPPNQMLAAYLIKASKSKEGAGVESGVDTMPYGHNKSLRMPLCAKTDGSLFEYLGVCEDTCCFAEERHIYQGPVSNVLAGWVVTHNRSFLYPFDVLCLDKLNSVFVRSKTTPLSEADNLVIESVIPLLEEHAGSSVIIKKGTMLVTPSDTFCPHHNRQHTGPAPKHCYYVLDKTTLLVSCFVPSDGQSKQTTLKWSETNRKYLPI